MASITTLSFTVWLQPLPRGDNMLRSICLLSLLTFFPIASAPQRQATSLEPDKPIERSLASGETHAYRVTLGAGQFLRVVADQGGIDVAIKIISPDGKPLTDVNLESDTKGRESAVWVIEGAGDYRIEIYAPGRNARGRYQLSLEAPRAANEQDRQRVLAQQNFMEAERSFDPSKPEALRQALNKYSAALPYWRAVGDRRMEATTSYNIGDIHRRLNEPAKAVEYLSQTLQLDRANANRESEAATLNLLGVVYSGIGETQKALDHFNQALPLRREAKDRTGEATTLNAIATVHIQTGESRKAIEIYNQVLSIRRDLKDRAGEATTLNAIGEAYRRLGEKRRALKYFQDALALRRAVRDTNGEAVTLNSLGAVYSDLGELQKAIEAYNQALPLRRDAASRAVTLINLGRAYDLLGVPQEAISFYNQALQLARSSSARRTEAQIFNFIGLSHWASGDHARALESLTQALTLSREVKDSSLEAAIQNNFGLVYSSMGEWRKAIDALNQSLPLIRKAGNRQYEAYALNNLGFAHEALGDLDKAKESHEQALKLTREVNDRLREGKARYGIARVESRRNRLKQARDQIEQTIKIVESLRAKLSSPELRASYRATTQQYYDLYIDVLMRMGRRAPRSNLVAEALQVSERARARSLIELLTEAGADIRQGVDAQLVERERELQEQINDKATEQIQSLGDPKKAGQVAALAREIEQLTIELRDTQSRIRASSPRYAALTQPLPLTAREIQNQILDANTMLLEYSLGEERSYLWAVTKTSLRGFTLPQREKIESAARRYYELITARNQSHPNETSQRRQARVANADAESHQAGLALSQMLLEPVAARLGNKRLIIVADGALQYLPFAALPKPTNGAVTPSSIHRPMIASHEMVTLPSASTLAALRGEATGRPTATKTIAVIADPVFEAKDERVKTVEIKAEKTDERRDEKNGEAAVAEPSRILLVKSAKEAGAVDAQFRIPRLPHTRNEAEAILSLTSPGAGKSTFDFAATRAAATNAELGQYRIVHLATHGFLNSLNPELSGLVFSLLDEKGAPQNGFLLAPEIYNLKLPATDLVVLSACQTGLGKEVRGEGVVGLTRGFMYAGAPRVVVSLWNVSDRATADLMKSFYRGMLARGLRPATALRAAQIEMWKQRQWRAPYYWAAFGLQGEWR
jgi:CHAT domain-containing protein/Flp pilus assembly protein TadD